jgi:microcystin-dependent protein
MSDAYIGEIRCFGFSFAPFNWAFCNGQLLSISQFSALFSILGTTFGGNGTTTFGLPNLQGRSPMHWGTSPGLNTDIGQVMGTTTVTLTPTQMPLHTHAAAAADVQKGQTLERSPGPTGTSFLSQSSGGLIYQNSPSTPNTPFDKTAISMAGNSLPHENQQPFLAMNFCICLNGTFPSRN